MTVGAVSGGGTGPPAPPRGRGRGPMTREEAQRLREEELAGQGHGKDCFIIPQANLDRFLPDGVTVSFHYLTSYHYLQIYILRWENFYKENNEYFFLCIQTLS